MHVWAPRSRMTFQEELVQSGGRWADHITGGSGIVGCGFRVMFGRFAAMRPCA